MNEMKNTKQLNESIKELKEIANKLPVGISTTIFWDAVEEKLQEDLMRIILLSAQISDCLVEESDE